MRKRRKVPRKLSLVKFDFTDLPEQYHRLYPFLKGHTYVFLGEIPNMPGHCVIAGHAGNVYFGYHTDDFVELPDESV